MISSTCNKIFQQSIVDYHITDQVDVPLRNPYPPDSLDYLLYKKSWIDTVQWHLEDIIRDPFISPFDALLLKRRIDQSNQQRTDIVECIDNWFLHRYKDVKPLPHASVNTESPAGAIDRLSILILKIFHMHAETLREDACKTHRSSCLLKLEILLRQKDDLSLAIDLLLKEIESGIKIMKVYFQMKMYNNESLNPVLYNAKYRV